MVSRNDPNDDLVFQALHNDSYDEDEDRYSADHLGQTQQLDITTIFEECHMNKRM